MNEARLLQGPLSDAMTHAGQLAMLRRLFGTPVPPEDFSKAAISAENVGPYQPDPVSPDEDWPGPPSATALRSRLAKNSSLIGDPAEMHIVEQLENTREKTLRLFELSDTDLKRTYQPGKWPVRHILHHLADAETVLFDRIRRVISEPRQVLWAFDGDAWAKNLDYTRMPLELSKRLYDATRSGILYQVRRHYANSGDLEFVHSETGIRTLKAEFDKVALHNEHHLEQINVALRNP
jgi:hypothetical protein